MIHKGSSACKLCRANTDPLAVPLHANCTCEVVTEDVEIGDVDATELAQTALDDGGFTYSVLNDAAPKTGYSVSPYPERSSVINASEFRYDDLRAYVAKNSDYLRRDNHMLGAWRDGNDVWLDVTVVLDDVDEAVALAKRANQIAIYDLDKGAVIETGGTGGVRARQHRRAKTMRLTRFVAAETDDDTLAQLFEALTEETNDDE